MPPQNVEVLTGHAQDMSVKYENDEFINTKVFPIYEAASPKLKFTRYLRGQQFQSQAERRQPGDEIKTSKVERDSVAFQTEQYAASDFITREDLRDAGLKGMLSPPIDLVQDAVEKNAKDLDLGREIRVAAHIFNETWAGNVDVAGAWLTASTSTFLANFDTAIGVLKKNGVNPKLLKLALDFGTFQALKRIDDLRDQLKYTSDRSLTQDLLARILQIGEVVVGGSIVNTSAAASGSDPFSSKYIWEETATKGSAFLYAVPKRVTKKSLMAGVQPRSKLDNKQARITETYYDPKKKAWFYDSMEETDILTTAAPAGYLWTDTILT